MFWAKKMTHGCGRGGKRGETLRGIPRFLSWLPRSKETKIYLAIEYTGQDDTTVVPRGR